MMFKFKKLAALIIAVVVLGALSVTALAAAVYGSPAEAVAGLTGRPLEQVVQERTETGKTYGQMADEANVLDEFKAAVLEMKKEYLDRQVGEGKLTQEEADQILAAIADRQALCDGTGSAQAGQCLGVGFGPNGCGMGSGTGCKGQGGNGNGQGNGWGNGNGAGLKLRDGSCGR